MSNKKNQEQDELQSVDEALSKSERFIENNRKQLLIIFSAIIVIVVGIVCYNSYYVAPRNVKAADRLATCVRYFEQDSFALALNGDGINEGLVDIIDDYGVTETADLAAFYAGICSYNLGDYAQAVKYLKRFDSSTVNLEPAKITLIGDCYVSMEKYADAAKYFEKAGAIENNLTAPRALNKAGICYEEMGNYTAAIRCYTTIKEKYFASQIAMDMDKRIARCNELAK